MADKTHPRDSSQIKKTPNIKHGLVFTSSMEQWAVKLPWALPKEGGQKTVSPISHLAYFCISLSFILHQRVYSWSILCFTLVSICTCWRAGKSSIKTCTTVESEDFHLMRPEAGRTGQKTHNMREAFSSSARLLQLRPLQDLKQQLKKIIESFHLEKSSSSNCKPNTAKITTKPHL